MCNSHHYTEKILAGSLSLTQDISRVIPLTSLSGSWQQTNWSFAGGLLLCFIQCLLLFLLFLLELRILLASQHVNILTVITTCSTTAMACRQPTASLIHLIGHLVLQQDRPTRWIKEAVHIRKEGHRAMNRDEGVTGQLADTPTRGFQLADWTTRGCHRRLCVLSFPFWRHLRDHELSSPRLVQSASWLVRELSSPRVGIRELAYPRVVQ